MKNRIIFAIVAALSFVPNLASFPVVAVAHNEWNELRGAYRRARQEGIFACNRAQKTRLFIAAGAAVMSSVFWVRVYRSGGRSIPVAPVVSPGGPMEGLKDIVATLKEEGGPRRADACIHEAWMGVLRSPNKTFLENMIQNPANVNARDGRGLAPLHKAVLLENPEMVRTLLAVPGINVAAKSDAGQTPLDLVGDNQEIEDILLDAPY